MNSKAMQTLSKLAREGKLCIGDTKMAELYTSHLDGDDDEALKGISVDGVVFAKDGSCVRKWNITIRGLKADAGGNEEIYSGSIEFPPEYPSRPPVLVYSERQGALDLCGTVIRNARVMAGWNEHEWAESNEISEVDESLELDLLPVIDKEHGGWKSVYWSSSTTVNESLERLRNFLHKGLKNLSGPVCL